MLQLMIRVPSSGSRFTSKLGAAAGTDAADHGIDADHPLILDLDATLLDSHSEKENTAPTYKRGFGFHPLLAFFDHGPGGTGEPAAAGLRPGNAGANTAVDHKTVLTRALKQLPWNPGYRVGRNVLVRTDSGGGTHEFLNHLTTRRLQYSIGFTPRQARPPRPPNKASGWDRLSGNDFGGARKRVDGGPVAVGSAGLGSGGTGSGAQGREDACLQP